MDDHGAATMTPTLLYLALTLTAAPPTAEDPRFTLIASHGGRKIDPELIARLVEQLGADTLAERREAERRLVLCGPQAKVALEAAAKHRDREIVKRSANARREIEEQARRLRGLLRELLDGADGCVFGDIQRLPDPAIRSMAFTAVEKPPIRLTVSMRLEIMRGVGDPVASVASAARSCINQFPSPGIDALVTLARDEDPRLRECAVMLFIKHPKEERKSLPVLLDAIKDRSAGVRRWAASRLVFYPGDKTFKALAEALKDADTSSDVGNVGSNAAYALTQNRERRDEVIALLTAISPDAPAQTRNGCLMALYQWVLREPSVGRLVKPHLPRFLRDPNPDVRNTAASLRAEIR